MHFEVSVIIPVYNAEKFLQRAVDSALMQEETGEVILIEDKSPDNALELCRALVSRNPKVRLLQHPGGENRGAGASRNLGIRNARFPFIAFLDADDWYLPGRFTETARKFLDDPSVDGVYAPVGTHSDQQEFELLGKRFTQGRGNSHVTFFKQRIDPHDLFYEMLTMRYGTFHTNGVVLKKSLLELTGGFNEVLRLHQDSELWVRCAFFGKLVGIWDGDVVAIRAVHETNRIHHINFHSKSLYHREIFRFFRKQTLPSRCWEVIVQKYAHYHPNRKFSSSGPLMQRLEKGLFWFLLKTNLLH